MNAALTVRLAVSLLAAGAAQAQVSGDYSSQFDYSYQVTGLPDFDQERAAIFDNPGCSNDGDRYCGPTSVMNLLGFLGTHGWSHIAPGDVAWEDYTTGDGWWSHGDQQHYNDVTLHLESLALDYMGMNPWSGTDSEELRTGTIEWLSEHEETWLDRFDVNTWGLDGDDWTESGDEIPTPAEIAYLAADGVLMVMRYGRYNWDWDGELVELLDRDGGHIVAVQALEDNYPGFPRLEYRNSSTDGGESPITQDEFRRADRRAVKTFITNGGGAGSRRFAIMPQGMTAHDFDPETTPLSLIDDFMLIQPKYGFTLTPDGDMLDLKLPGLEEGASFGYDLVPPPPGGRIVHARLSPCGLWRAVLSAGEPGGEAPGLTLMHRATGSTQRLTGMGSPRRVVFGRQRELYAADHDPASDTLTLVAYEIDGVQHEDSWRETARVTLPLADALAADYDDATDSLLVLDPRSHAVLRFPRGLEGAFGVEPLPSSIPLTGSAWMAVSPADGTLWLSCPGIGLAAQLERDLDRGWVEVGSHWGHGIGGLSLDDRGDLFASVGGVVRQFRVGAAGGLEERGTSLFVGQPCGEEFQISRSRTSVHRDLYDAPGSHDLGSGEVDGDSVCRADFNGDGRADTLDFLAFLNAWAAGNLAADRNSDGVVNSLDFLAFLNEWAAGCEG